MKIYTISSLPIDEVMRDLAEVFEVNFKKERDEYFITLPNHIGSGIIKGIKINDGFGLIQYACTFNEKTEIHFTVNNVHPLKFIYVIEGNLEHRLTNENKVHKIESYMNAIVASSDHNGHIIYFKPDLKTCIFSLEINRKKFKEANDYDLSGINVKVRDLFDDVEARNSFYYEGDYSLTMADVFQSLENYSNDNFLYQIFIKSIAYKTFVLQLEQYMDDLKSPIKQKVLRKSELMEIKKASDFISENIVGYGGIADLQKITSLNPLKLQKGFQYCYGKSIHQFVIEERLNLGKLLLLENEDSISEIVYKIGLTSKSYFSRIFKEQYGVVPSHFRRNAKNKI